MTHSTVTINLFQSRDVLLNLTAKTPLDDIFVLERRGDSTELFLGQIPGLHGMTNPNLLEQATSQGAANAFNVGQ